MANESRVLYEIPGSAPSGAADAMFKIFEDRRALETKKKEAEITKDIERSRQAEAAKFSTSLENLRHQYRIDESRKIFEQTTAQDMLLRQQESGTVAGAAATAANQGVRLPFLEPGMYSPEAAEQGQPAFAPPVIPPGGAKFYGDLVSKGIVSHFEQEEKRGQIRAEAQKSALLESLKLVTPDQVLSAQSQADKLELLDKDHGYIRPLRGIQVGSYRDEYEKLMQKSADAVENAKMKRYLGDLQSRTRLQITEKTNQTKTLIAEMEKKLKVEREDFHRLQAAEDSVKADLMVANEQLKSLMDQLGKATSMTEMQNLQAQIERTRAQYTELAGVHTSVTRQIARFGLVEEDDQTIVRRLLPNVIRELAPKETEQSLEKKPELRQKVIEEARRRLERLKSLRQAPVTPRTPPSSRP